MEQDALADILPKVAVSATGQRMLIAGPTSIRRARRSAPWQLPEALRRCAPGGYRRHLVRRLSTAPAMC